MKYVLDSSVAVKCVLPEGPHFSFIVPLASVP